MSVWLTIPSARPVAEVNTRMELWRKQGYRIALWRDPAAEQPQADLLIVGAYPGYSIATNALIRMVFGFDSACDWVVCGGDDIDPDLAHTADEIARQCSEQLGGSFGVMQPTGDRWGENDPWARLHHPTEPAYIDRICGSPWIGREFVRRTYGGRGPMWPEYWHMFNDEELQEVAKALGVLWQRRDLIHFHHHAQREAGATVPAFLQRAYSPENWREMEAVFRARKAAGFPGAFDSASVAHVA